MLFMFYGNTDLCMFHVSNELSKHNTLKYYWQYILIHLDYMYMYRDYFDHDRVLINTTDWTSIDTQSVS